ncbi:MAG TPA: DUF4129 domain-containing protein [Candidatus Binatus sp.]|nr:DUF4129 domain-containing protein [Candidatus Binatus sp.]
MASTPTTPRRQGRVIQPRHLYFLLVLFGLSIALGILSRNQAGGSWLANSYWLLYVIELLPILALGAIVVVTIFLAWNLRDTSDALGSGMARKMRKRTNRRIQTIVFMTSWAIAIGVLWYKCHGIPCRPSPISGDLQNLVLANQNGSNGPAGQAISILLGASLTISNIVQSEWFDYAFFGLIIVSSVIYIRSYMVALNEYRAEVASVTVTPHVQGLKAVQDAIEIFHESRTVGPRERILACYNRMIKAAHDMGANITPDQTARELERTIRGTLMINGKGIRVLTGLFEEARYSLHMMTEEDSQEAYSSLVMIQSELTSSLDGKA